MIRFLLLLLVLFSIDVTASSYLNRLDKITTSKEGVKLSQLNKFILPDGWIVLFEIDNFRNIEVDIHKNLKWHTQFDVIGRQQLLSVFIDGAKRRVLFAKPLAGYEPGTSIVNSSSISFRTKQVLADLFERSEINELNFQNSQLRTQMAKYQSQRQAHWRG